MKKTTRIVIRVPESMKEILKRKAARLGLTLSDYARKTMLAYKEDS